MSFIQYRRDKHLQSTAAPSLLAMGMAMAFMPAAFAAEDTVIVEGATTADAVNREEQDYSVKTTAAGTKMPMTQRDIPQSVSIVSQQRMEDQQLQTLGEVMTNTLGISGSQADS
ncbi:ferric-rhodotorulic acid/ferric-coprogen receptor FhuE, partial [Salmonella enterica subsp. enterica serovar Heidelberg]|nr:ferric-rhodotorulic acid/ferric-coprogen receptor FhuE [Salmonella enterica subsp. enterica serovar Heidelberg]